MQPTAGQLRALIKEAGYKLHFQSTDEKGWEKVLRLEADIIVIAGGDGTVTSVARRVVGKWVPLAVLPLGTANNISKTLGISELPVTYLIPSWRKSQSVSFDAGLARGPWGRRHFIEGAGIGLLTSSMPRVESSKTLAQLRISDVKVSYAQQLFRDHVLDAPAVAIDGTLDGNDISGKYLLMEVMNIQYIGPNLLLAPDVSHGSGKFEIVLVSESNRGKLRSHIKQWQDGKLVPPEFETLRGKRLEIEWTGFKIHLDDKVWPKPQESRGISRARLKFEIVPKAITFLMPAEIYAQQKLAKKNSENANSKSRKG